MKHWNYEPAYAPYEGQFLVAREGQDAFRVAAEDDAKVATMLLNRLAAKEEGQSRALETLLGALEEARLASGYWEHL